MKISPDILKEYLLTIYQEEEIDYSGEEWVLPSIAKPNKKKLYVNVEKCKAIDFFSGVGYSAFTLIQELQGFDSTRETEDFVRNFILERIGKTDIRSLVNSKEPKKKEQPIVKKIDLPETVNIFSDNTIARQAHNYLKERQISDDQIRQYHLSVGVDGKYRRRIIIPFIEDNNVVWFQGRALFQYQGLRYLNPKGVDKSMLVYNIDNMGDTAYIVEGTFDAMMINGQALCSVTASEWQISKILARNPKRIIVIPDNDKIQFIAGKKVSPGYDGALRTISKFVKAKYPIQNLGVVFVEDGKDLGDIGKDKAMSLLGKPECVNLNTLMKFQAKGAGEKVIREFL